MWYFAWTLGTLLACSLGVTTTLVLEYVESGKAGQEGI